MQLLRVQIEIAADIERVFRRISDHEAFLDMQKQVTAMIFRPGTVERNGLGCVREVLAGRKVRYSAIGPSGLRLGCIASEIEMASTHHLRVAKRRPFACAPATESR
jgi:hypothetical protein